MSTQPIQTAKFPPRSTSTPLTNKELCPTCGQDVPPERFEEISGRIAARERERVLSITANLEKQFAVEKAQAEVAANAALNLERKESAAREAQAREEVRASAEEAMREKELDAEKTRKELAESWQQKLENAEAARSSAEQTQAGLLTQLTQAREASVKTIDALKAEASRREAQIREEAKQAADSAAEMRMAEVAKVRQKSEAGLQAMINEANTGRLAAEQKEAAMVLQLSGLKRAKDEEVARIKEEAAANATRIRENVAAEVEARFSGTLRDHQTAVAEAVAKANAAEQKVSKLAEHHASEMEANLNAQREILEKAKEAEINIEKSRAFQENQKLSSKVNELQRALEKKTADELGEGAEVDLYEALRTEFPEDEIGRIPRGVSGADVRHVVKLRGEKCGTILYDSKNHKRFLYEHATKLRTDQLAERAEHAVLSTHKFPDGKNQICIHEGVILANPARVVSIATILRQHILQVHTLRLSNIERESKTVSLYEFITSAQYADLLHRVDERADHLLVLQEKEIRWHKNNWNNQGEAIRTIQKARADIADRITSIIGTLEDSGELSEAS